MHEHPALIRKIDFLKNWPMLGDRAGRPTAASVHDYENVRRHYSWRLIPDSGIMGDKNARAPDCGSLRNEGVTRAGDSAAARRADSQIAAAATATPPPPPPPPGIPIIGAAPVIRGAGSVQRGPQPARRTAS